MRTQAMISRRLTEYKRMSAVILILGRYSCERAVFTSPETALEKQQYWKPSPLQCQHTGCAVRDDAQTEAGLVLRHCWMMRSLTFPCQPECGLVFVGLLLLWGKTVWDTHCLFIAYFCCAESWTQESSQALPQSKNYHRVQAQHAPAPP